MFLLFSVLKSLYQQKYVPKWLFANPGTGKAFNSYCCCTFYPYELGVKSYELRDNLSILSMLQTEDDVLTRTMQE